MSDDLNTELRPLNRFGNSKRTGNSPYVRILINLSSNCEKNSQFLILRHGITTCYFAR
jgi:hypothetical protein